MSQMVKLKSPPRDNISGPTSASNGGLSFKYKVIGYLSLEFHCWNRYLNKQRNCW